MALELKAATLIQACSRRRLSRQAFFGSLLRSATVGGEIEQVAHLMRLSPSCINYSSSSSQHTALHWAVISCRVETLQVLLSSTRTDVNSSTARGWTALHVACRGGMAECAQVRNAQPCLALFFSMLMCPCPKPLQMLAAHPQVDGTLRDADGFTAHAEMCHRTSATRGFATWARGISMC